MRYTVLAGAAFRSSRRDLDESEYMQTMPNIDQSETVTFSAGERILKKGEEAGYAYMILSGKVRVYLKNEDKTLELAHLGEGEIFGETALLMEGAYGANVDALEETRLLIITRQSLQAMIDSAHPVLASLFHMMIRRLGETNKKLLNSETREFMDIGFI